MRMSDWRSDVWSSDLGCKGVRGHAAGLAEPTRREQGKDLTSAHDPRFSADGMEPQELLIVWHSRTGASEAMAQAEFRGTGSCARIVPADQVQPRSEAGRVGKEGVHTCRSRGSAEY